MKVKILRNSFLHEYMRGLYSHSREYRELLLRKYFRNMYLHLFPLHLYGYSSCIHTPQVPIHTNMFGELISVTRANTGKHSWRMIYVLVSCQGVVFFCESIRAARQAKFNRPDLQCELLGDPSLEPFLFFIECFRGGTEGGGNFTSSLLSGPFFVQQNEPFLP